MSERRALGPDLSVSTLCLGGNVFGWTADEAASRDVLDGYVERGGNFIDTSDSYSFWAEGNNGGESEAIIGRWLSGRSDRDSLVVATKVSQHPEYTGMAPETIRGAVERSCERLGVSSIDLYYAHFDDADTPLEKSVAAMSELVDLRVVRALGVSNYSPERVREWLRICDEEGYHRPVALQPQYSLMERGIEADLLPLARQEGLGVLPYYALARGFLTGKYAAGATVESPRASVTAAYLDDRARAVLAELSRIAEAYEVEPASVAIAWLAGRPGVTAPIASARTLEQLDPLMTGAALALSSADSAALDAASARGHA